MFSLGCLRFPSSMLYTHIISPSSGDIVSSPFFCRCCWWRNRSQTGNQRPTSRLSTEYVWQNSACAPLVTWQISRGEQHVSVQTRSSLSSRRTTVSMAELVPCFNASALSTLSAPQNRITSRYIWKAGVSNTPCTTMYSENVSSSSCGKIYFRGISR